ncbi:hypothetical protein D3C87_1924130 [compost metagenome]
MLLLQREVVGHHGRVLGLHGDPPRIRASGPFYLLAAGCCGAEADSHRVLTPHSRKVRRNNPEKIRTFFRIP